MLTNAPGNRESPFTELARAKLVKVLGPEQGTRVFEDTLEQMGVADLATPDELYAFSQLLVSLGGMEAAVGALLGVAAVVRGAAGKPS